MSTDDDHDARPPRTNDLRAKDLLTRPRAEVEADLDPATLAELSSWFDRPNAALIEDQATTAAIEDAETTAFQEAQQRRAKACAAADPAFVRHIERHETARPLPVARPPIRVVIDETIVLPLVRHQLERQSAEEPISDERSYDLPADLNDILAKHNAPQALLRDLYRPITDFELRLESPFDDLPDLDPLKESREIMRARIAIEWAEPLFPQGVEARAVGRRLMRAPWSEHLAVVQALVKARQG